MEKKTYLMNDHFITKEEKKQHLNNRNIRKYFAYLSVNNLLHKLNRRTRSKFGSANSFSRWKIFTAKCIAAKLIDMAIPHARTTYINNEGLVSM